ncbi:hypothetical protein WMY93_026994 [Mugilogobius chulae]|uniref:C-type lectin domain-containing protein n=1 Tax=Mugilogobius chulae TaxID=88201 RepID=A0AAW0MV10_9GOBI
MTWSAAQQYCRLHYHDLATFTSMEDIQRVNRPSSYAYAWIGLIDDPPSWYRVMGNLSSPGYGLPLEPPALEVFKVLVNREPDFYIANNLLELLIPYRSSSSQITEMPDSDPSTARSGAPPAKHSQRDLVNLIGGHWVWIGLSRQPYRWSDNRISNFKNWIGGEPDNKLGIEHCVVEYSDPEHLWLDAACEGFRVVLGFHTVYYEYHFISTGLTWSAAQQYCRLHYDDLATFTSMDDIQRVSRPSNYIYAWIGLVDDTASWKGVMGNLSNSWVWSATGTTGGYQGPWATEEPDFYSANNACVMMRNGLWTDDNCNTGSYCFVCFTGSLKPGSKEYILVESLSSWSEALSFCREHYVDLAIIEDESDFNTVANLVTTNWVWIGLSRQPYRWSDNRISNFKIWIAENRTTNKALNTVSLNILIQNIFGWMDHVET